VKNWLSKLYLCFIFFFLYAPIAVLVLFSFNASSRATGTWTGFTLEWYGELFADQQIRSALGYTFAIALISTVVSMVAGTISAIGIYQLKRKARQTVLQVNYLPIISPEIVTAIGLMILFQSIRLRFGFSTMLLAHIMFCIPYVILQVLPRLYAMDANLAEAAMDLGATPWQAIRLVVIPEIRPGIFSGALMAFTMSLDDFVISLFNTGNGVTNLSIEVYSMARRGIRPTVNALATLMVVIVFITVALTNQIQLRKKVRG